MEVAGANRRWRLPFRCRGSRRESAVAQLFSLGNLPMKYFLPFLFALVVLTGCKTEDYATGKSPVCEVHRRSQRGWVLRVRA